MQTHYVEVSNQVNPIQSQSEKDDKARLDSLLQDVALSQDKRAFSELFSWFSPKIRAYGLKKFNDPTLAMDLVQETMTLVWRKAALFNSEKGNASGWIFTVMRNHSFDMLRKMQSNKEDTVSDELWPLFDKQTETVELDWLEIKKLKNAVNVLPHNQRVVVEGIYEQGLTQQELSHQLSEPIGTIKSRLRLALTKLRQEYEHE
ncbi:MULTISPECIES: sigma-70 family RNA polymerase sigma factor [unclassified Aliivibrio]|uniref:sigma-70 family RNA polymerase sigma factor n=1 Tax=unclassified Aliivibrio TaxID=2645654 RepID=UPI00080ED9A7|nr:MULTISPECIES: sigma-70 family RNA polymerase sigma factor [unclassified Aliivibrio]OCH13711.1 RNA polymerase subunit sigma [Aliivibrio sp. 1S165]OCH23758.1 RNA polymerase subunit sigma [Aliivibrio sp. 1S128]OCH31647.1 RNA polymerase subunit sigma [Aliivibrio sp. 1S175]